MNEASGKFSLCSNETTLPGQPHGFGSFLSLVCINFLSSGVPIMMVWGGGEENELDTLGEENRNLKGPAPRLVPHF